MRSIECRECGKGFTSRQYTAMFCCAPCRATFNKRRRDRGAELYDVYMAAYREGVHPTDRDAALAAEQKIVNAYIAADKEKRHGRPSWQPWRYAKLRIPMVYGTSGDKR